jgi:hypothetical protein
VRAAWYDQQGPAAEVLHVEGTTVKLAVDLPERPPRCGPVEVRTWTEYTSDAHPRRHVAPPRYVDLRIGGRARRV